jgi:2-alkyl-3-oxoalkanoate reductase
MKVFLTGASGFVGGELARELLEQGHSVTAAVRASSRTDSIPSGCEVRVVDLASPANLEDHLRGTDVIHHVAGAVKAVSEEEFDRINAGTTAAMVKAANTACPGALFVLTSSQAAAGPCGTGPVTAYGRSKVLAEQVLTGFARRIVIRPPAVFGPGDRATESLFKWAKRGFTVSMGSGKGGFCMISVHDLACFMAGVMECEEAIGKTLQPSWPELVTWKRFHGALEKAAGRKILNLRVPSGVVHTAGLMSEIMATFTGACPMVTRDKARELTAPEWLLMQHRVEEVTGWKPSRSPERTLLDAMGNGQGHW